MIGDDNDDIIEELFRSCLQKYEENFQNKMTGSDFEFDGVNFLYYGFALNLDKINKQSQRISKIKPFIDQYN